MLQACHFAAENMDKTHGMLELLIQISNNIKTLCPVEHGDVPPSLYVLLKNQFPRIKIILLVDYFSLLWLLYLVSLHLLPYVL